MYDGASLSDPVRLVDPIRLQRAVGELRVGVRRHGDETVLEDLRQVGCLKARFPRRVVPGWMDIVMLNTGGGVAAGDRLDLSFSADFGTRVTIATQAAERFYRATAADAPSRVRTRLTVAEGAVLEWLPQETILFDRSTLDRRLEVTVASDGRFLGVETLVFGRAAMGEAVRQGRLRDLFRVRRGTDLLLHDAIRLDGDIADLMHGPGTGQGAHVLATLVYVAQDAEQRLDAVRLSFEPHGRGLDQAHYLPSWTGRTPLSFHPSAHEPPPPVEAAASAWNGMLVARLLGHGSASVRAAVTAALNALRDSRPLPRVWLC